MSTTADTSLVDPIRIRAGRREDSDRVFELLKQLASSYAPDRSAFDATFALIIDDVDGSLLLVAEDSTAQVRGYALTTISSLLYTNGRSAQLQELVVDEKHQGLGHGTALIEELELICRSRGVRQLTVPSRRSADFYERLGYHSTADFLKRTFD